MKWLLGKILMTMKELCKILSLTCVDPHSSEKFGCGFDLDFGM